MVKADNDVTEDETAEETNEVEPSEPQYVVKEGAEWDFKSGQCVFRLRYSLLTFIDNPTS